MTARAEIARRRLRADDRPYGAVFDPDTLADLPEPAQRFLRRALPTGTPLATVVDLDATGTIKLGHAWWRFRSTQTIKAGSGFVWKPLVRRGPMYVGGADTYVDGTGTMTFRLFGLVPVARADGPDTDRSAAGRLAAETVAWLPHATTPQGGATWAPVDDDRATVTLATPAGPVDVTIVVDDHGRVISMAMARWSDATDPPTDRSFGGSFASDYVTHTGVRIMGDGRIGWDWGTPQWNEGEFFRFHITNARHNW